MDAALLVLGVSLTASAATPGALNQARFLAESRHYERAVAVLDGLLGKQPDNLEAGLLRGVLLTRLGRTEAAIGAFTKLADRHPELPEPHNNLAVLYATQRRYELARVALLRAIKLQPRYEIAYENLGDIYARLAVAAYRRAAELNPANTAIGNKARKIELLTAPPRATSVERTSRATTDGARSGALSVPATATEVAKAGISRNGAAASSVQRCYAFDGFASEVEAQRAGARLDAAISVKPHRRRVLLNYKVYLPPLANRQAADAQIRRMRSTGIKDLVRIPRGDLTNGIALGVYASEEAARGRVDELRVAGYDAHFKPRYATRNGYRVEARFGGSSAPPSAAIRGFPAPTACN